ncbi:MAG: Smr/MutS family protein [Bacteroidales bacterium]|nr:Smr/MutS family protein [Bacteroidales bacterium]
MIFPNTFEEKTGFNRIREMISENCLCQLGRNCVESLSLMTNFERAEHELQLTDELRQILTFEENFPQDNYLDVTPYLKKLEQTGTYLETAELFELRKSLTTLKNIRNYIHSDNIKNKYQTFSKEFSQLELFPSIEKLIDNILTKEGGIKDGASENLKQIREQKKQKHVAVNRKIQSILKSARSDGLVDHDAEVTLRDGRPVIPVPATNKRRISGLVHDESSSGKTVFIEPTVVVELNNEIRELEYAERREIIKILDFTSGEIRPYAGELIVAFEQLGKIDFVRAKAKFAINIGGIKPIISKEKQFIWKNAVHPLLYLSHKSENKKVVPLDIYLNSKNRILLISGPNAGGKSVCLKTTGLLQYMIQCGILVPMSENSEMCLFNKIFIDIGDEQSLENDLSTYSSHLLNMKYFISNADNETLILIDEFGTGTEPTLGGTIAEAILEELNAKKSFGVITTHYGNLKHFASNTPGIINGAMLFDTQKIEPVFKLSVGKPGSSFAIDIARKIGIPDHILTKANEKTGKDQLNFEKHLREIIRDKKYWNDKRQKIKNVEKTLDNLYADYSEELESLNRERKNIIKQARTEAENLLKLANKNIERTIREIKESKADKEKTKEIRTAFEEFKRNIAYSTKTENDISAKVNEINKASERLVKHSREIEKSELESRKKKDKKQKDSISVGDRVKMNEMNTVGEVLEINSKNILVAFGNMITTVDSSRLEIVSGENSSGNLKAFKQSSAGFNERRLNFKSEVDVRGKRADEALEIVKDMIDDALVVAVPNLQILHGKGNGILRQLIRDYLSSLDVIKSFKDAHADRGGAGITLVELDI